MRGADALELAKQYQPSAVSLDVFLPDMLGWSVLSQLKQNPLTRHIPVQIITLDEDKHHGLARGAFSFVTKPTTTEGVEAALRRIKEYSTPRRKRLLVVEDNPAEQMSISELLGHDDVEIETAGTGRGALDTLRRQPADCVVLDLRLPDMTGFRSAGRACSRRTRCRTCRSSCSPDANSAPEEDARLHTMARSIVVKGVESPERLLDETALFLHRVVTDLPPEKQRMLERLNSIRRGSGRPNRAAGRRRCPQHLCAEQRAGTARHAGLDRHDRQRGDQAHRIQYRHRHCADGHHDAGDGRLSDHGANPEERRISVVCRSSRSPQKR